MTPEVQKGVLSVFQTARKFMHFPPPYPEDDPDIIALNKGLNDIKKYILKALEEKRKLISEGKLNNVTDFATSLYSTKDAQTGEFLDPEEVITDSLDIINGEFKQHMRLIHC
jgi:hypothetical protein